MNSMQEDYIQNYDDAEFIDEFADSEISCYYYKQKEYYEKDTSRAYECLIEMGYELKDFSDLEDAICRAGVCMWYEDNIMELYEDERLEDYYRLLEELEELEEQEKELLEELEEE